MIVGINGNDEAVLYDLVNIQNKKITESSQAEANLSSLNRGENSVTDTLSQQSNNVNNIFSESRDDNILTPDEESDLAEMFEYMGELRDIDDDEFREIEDEEYREIEDDETDTQQEKMSTGPLLLRSGYVILFTSFRELKC